MCIRDRLRTMQALGLTMVNEMLREVYANDILPKEAKKNPLRGYRSEAAMTMTTTAKRSGKKRDISDVVCHNCQVKGRYANKCPAKKLSLGTPPRSGASYTRRGHIQTMSALLSRQPLNHSPLFLHCQRPFPLPQRLVHLPSWQAHRSRPLRKAGYNYWSTGAAHLIWWTQR